MQIFSLNQSRWLVHLCFTKFSTWLGCSWRAKTTASSSWPLSLLREVFSGDSDNGKSFLIARTVQNPPAMRETWLRPLGWEDSLEKEMATPSSILAWRIPWAEDPGRLPSMGSQRVGQDWATSIHPFRGSGKGESRGSNQALTLLCGSCVTVLPWWLSDKGPSCRAGVKGNAGSIPGSERSHRGGEGNLLQFLARKIPWTEEPGRLQPMGSKDLTRLSTAQLCDWN